MSVEVIARVLSDSPTAGNAKVVLLGIANHAHPDGSHAYPSVETLARYARVSRRTVQRVLRALERDGQIVREGVGPHGQIAWRVVFPQPRLQLDDEPQRGRQLDAREAVDVTGVKLTRGVTAGAEGVTPVSPEPSLEPSSSLESARASSDRTVTHDRRRATAEQITAGERLLGVFNEVTGRRLGAWTGTGQASESLRQIIGALIDHPEITTDEWEAAIRRMAIAIEQGTAPSWTGGRLRLGQIFGPRAREWALDDRAPTAPAARRPGDPEREERRDRSWLALRAEQGDEEAAAEYERRFAGRAA
jgi:hypothetical protein